MFYDILDKKRLNILLLLRNFKKDFYLAGGTALALQIGHRDSIDFDFFTPTDIDTAKLFSQCREIFQGHKILKIQDEHNTLTVLIDDDVKLSFFTYKYKLIKKTIDEENLRLAAIEDIACMKFAAITGRASNKDYIDLYFILQQFDLKKLLAYSAKKLPELDTNLILKSLVYFDDINKEPIKYKNNHKISFEVIKTFLIKTVQKIK